MENKFVCKLKSKFLPFSWCTVGPYLLFLLIVIVLLSSCSTIDRKDDAVRIKKNNEFRYSKRIDKDKNIIKRDGTTLRGTVQRIVKETKPNSCPIEDSTTFSSKYFVQFLDSEAKSILETEKIPIEDIELIGQKPELAKVIQNSYNNINWFENFNDPLDPRAIREVPVDSIFINNCPNVIDCNCSPLNIGLDCPDCNYNNYFFEIRAAYAVYNDKNSLGIPVGRDAYAAEFAFGYRWDRLGLGMMFNTGVPIYNSKTGLDIYRPLMMLHGRYQFDKVLCMIPFVYTQLGLTIDAQSLELCGSSQCEDLDVEINCVDLPISYGFGIGMDIPIPSCLFDISFDLGYKSVLVGETFNTFMFNNVSDARRINMLVFRLGVTLGY